MNELQLYNRYNDPRRIAVGKLSSDLWKTVKAVEESKQRKYIVRHGKVVAALVPLEDVAILDEMSEKNTNTNLL